MVLKYWAVDIWSRAAGGWVETWKRDTRDKAVKIVRDLKRAGSAAKFRVRVVMG